MTITNKVSLKSVNGGNTPVADVVDAPTIGTATAGIESATVTYTAATTGGAATSFGAISTPGSITGTSATSPITVSGLTGGTAYTFKTYGINTGGTWSSVLSAASNSVTPTVASAFESIATVTVGSGGSSSITFSSIPATFTHLQLRCLAKNTTAGSGDQAYQIAFNSDTTYTNYRTHYLQGEGSAAYSGGAQVSGLYAVIGQAPKAGSTSVFGVSVTDILDYTNTSKNKITRTLDGDDMNGSGAVNLRSALWLNTSAINRIDITLYAGLTFAEYSKFALYGIKGA